MGKCTAQHGHSLYFYVGETPRLTDKHNSKGQSFESFHRMSYTYSAERSGKEGQLQLLAHIQTPNMFRLLCPTGNFKFNKMTRMACSMCAKCAVHKSSVMFHPFLQTTQICNVTI
jgi:hypothetical protein